ILLSGGTQMCAVLAIARALGLNLSNKVAVGTTRWVVKDVSSDLLGLVKDIYPEVPIAYVNLDFSTSKYEGLRAYEHGYVKEGVGAGGTLIACTMVREVSIAEIFNAVEEEYERVTNLVRED
ncbi:MAG: TIGR00303 family protein, partial [Sulfolobales archaeon]